MTPTINGIVTMQSYDALTGEILDSYGPEYNQIVDEGVEALWKRVSIFNSVSAYTMLHELHAGTDIGPAGEGWTTSNPQPADRDFTAANQTLLFSFTDVTFLTPTDDLFVVEANLVGQEYFDGTGSLDASFDINSMTLRFPGNVVFAFKRFPTRTLSRGVNLLVKWRFTVQNKDEYCEALV